MHRIANARPPAYFAVVPGRARFAIAIIFATAHLLLVLGLTILLNGMVWMALPLLSAAISAAFACRNLGRQDLALARILLLVGLSTAANFGLMSLGMVTVGTGVGTLMSLLSLAAAVLLAFGLALISPVRRQL